jgi:hypothetical protein
LAHIAIEWILAIPRRVGNDGATFWDPRSANLVSQNSQIFNFHDVRHSWNVTSSPNGPWTSKLVLGFSSKARGCQPGGLQQKYILKNGHKLWETSFFLKHGYLFNAF